MKFARRKFKRSLVLPYASASHLGAISATRFAKSVWLAWKPQALRRRMGIRQSDGPGTFRGISGGQTSIWHSLTNVGSRPWTLC